MSIHKFGQYYMLECDVCGEAADEEFDEFFDAVEWKKDYGNGWISKRVQGEWEDVCPNCH
jgi:hypothetical protein